MFEYNEFVVKRGEYDEKRSVSIRSGRAKTVGLLNGQFQLKVGLEEVFCLGYTVLLGVIQAVNYDVVFSYPLVQIA